MLIRWVLALEAVPTVRVAVFATADVPRARMARIVYLGTSWPALEAELVSAFRQGLHDLRYAEGQSAAITVDGPSMRSTPPG
jgi:hypothetical protein